MLKKIGRGFAFALLFGGIAGLWIRVFLGSGSLDHGAMDAAPIAAMGLGALIISAVGENFTYAKTDKPAPTWSGRLFFAVGGCWFLYGAWSVWHQ